MQRQIILPDSRASWLAERTKDVTSTESPALFGLSAYCTAYELACLKTGKIDDQFKETERTGWGTALQDAIATRVAHVFGVVVKAKPEYIRIPTSRMGSSFDYEIVGVNDAQVDDNRLRQAFGANGPGLLEIKNVDSLVFKNQWLTGEQPEAPAHIEIQLQHQAEVSDLNWGCIAALVGGNRLELILRLRDTAVGEALRAKVEKFWHDLSRDVYPPVQLPEDADVIKQIYDFAEPGKVMNAMGEAVPDGMAAHIAEYLAAAADEKAAKDRKTTAQAQLLQMIGDHEKVLTDVATISCGLVAPTWIEAYERKAFRYWKITPKKAKAVETK